MDAFMGTIMPVAFQYAPRGWMFCNGQTLPIAQNSALFSLLGTMYGGDGQNTFGLPDLRGRVPVGSQGPGPGIATVAQGEKAGTNNVTVIATGAATVTLAIANLPAHDHEQESGAFSLQRRPDQDSSVFQRSRFLHWQIIAHHHSLAVY